jgi:hypothetical protein
VNINNRNPLMNFQNGIISQQLIKILDIPIKQGVVISVALAALMTLGVHFTRAILSQKKFILLSSACLFPLLLSMMSALYRKTIQNEISFHKLVSLNRKVNLSLNRNLVSNGPQPESPKIIRVRKIKNHPLPTASSSQSSSMGVWASSSSALAAASPTIQTHPLHALIEDNHAIRDDQVEEFFRMNPAVDINVLNSKNQTPLYAEIWKEKPSFQLLMELFRRQANYIDGLPISERLFGNYYGLKRCAHRTSSVKIACEAIIQVVPNCEVFLDFFKNRMVIHQEAWENCYASHPYDSLLPDGKKLIQFYDEHLKKNSTLALKDFLIDDLISLVTSYLEDFPEELFYKGKRLQAQNDEQARYHFAVARDLGHIESQTNLGIIHLEGLCGVEKDLEFAIKILLESSNAGHATAMVILAQVFEDAGNKVEARKWYIEAAKQQNTIALAWLVQNLEEIEVIG